jgi:ATP-binding cassette, subfamily B, bacterial MsbA
MKDFFVALQYTTRYRFYAFLNILFNIFSAIFNLLSLLLFIPFLKLLFDKTPVVVPTAPVFNDAAGWGAGVKVYLGEYTNYFMMSWISESGKIGALLHICLIILILFFLKNVSRYLAMFYLAVIRNGVVRDLRKELHDKLIALPLGYYTEERKGDLISRVGNDVYEVELSIMSSLELIYREPFTILIFLTTMIFWSWELTLISLILMPLSALVIGRVGKSLKRTSAKGQSKLGELMSTVEETIGGLRIIKSFTAETAVKNKFEKVNEDFTNLSIRLYRKRDLASPLSEFLGSIVMVTMVYLGGQLILEGDGSALTGEQFITFIIVFSQLLRPIQGIATAYSNINKGLASKARIDEVLNTHERIVEKSNAKTATGFSDAIEFRNVGFAYKQNLVLNNISFKLEKGKTIALVGQSGSGKSTIADLLPRFYDTGEGMIVFDGTDVKEFTLKSLRSQMGIVSQESILFNDTVLANIALGDENPDVERVREAARIANALVFIDELEEGLSTNIGDRGSKLSGGQRQRLAIARAVYKNPPILILDEATSALDTESERLVQDALYKLMQNRTTLVIAHRLSTIQHADEIIVLHQGTIVERGTHQQLFDSNGMYRKLCEMQSFV